MSSNSEGVHPPALEPEDALIEEMFSQANPNPERIGCPSRDELALLARRLRPIGDPGYDHLANCSPCFIEFRALQQSTQRSAGTLARRWAVAAAVIVGALIGWLAYSAWSRSAPVITSPRPPVEDLAVRIEVDLRPYAVTRSNSEPPSAKPLVFPQSMLRATVILPVGSEPGEYELQLLDTTRQRRVSSTSAARLQDYRTTFEVTLDLRPLGAGSYQLAIRRRGESWRSFPVEIR
jgi:hypothetical protein